MEWSRGILLLGLAGCVFNVEVDREPESGEPSGGEQTSAPGGGLGSEGTDPGTGTGTGPGGLPSVGAPCGGDCDWAMEVVDTFGQPFFDPFATFDAAVTPDGVAHVVLFDPGDHEVRHLRSGGWGGTVVLRPEWQQGAWFEGGLALEAGADGALHLVTALDVAAYSSWDGRWDTAELPSTLFAAASVALALDSDQRPHAFVEQDYYRWDEAAGRLGAGPQLPMSVRDVALDGDDVPHVAAYDVNRVHHLVLGGNAWSSAPVVALAANSLATGIGPDGVGHVVFTTDTDQYASDNGVFHAWTTERGWEVEQLDEIGSFRAIDLAIDAGGRPIVSYFDADLDRLFLAWRTASGDWEDDLVANASGSSVWKTVLRLDPTTSEPLLFAQDDTSEQILLFRGSPR